MIKLFDVTDTAYLGSVTVMQAREALAICSSGEDKPSKGEAAQLVDKLLDFYSHQTFRSAQAASAFAAAASGLVMEVSVNATKRAFHPLTGLPRKEEFLSVAKVSKALQEEQARFFRIAANARWVIAQKENAERMAKEDAEIEASKGTAEQRAASVAKIMASMRGKATTDGA